MRIAPPAVNHRSVAASPSLIYYVDLLFIIFNKSELLWLSFDYCKIYTTATTTCALLLFDQPIVAYLHYKNIVTYLFAFPELLQVMWRTSKVLFMQYF